MQTTFALGRQSHVIVLDQFEQLRGGRKIFSLLRRLARAAKPPHRITWVIAFRREFSADWMDFVSPEIERGIRPPRQFGSWRCVLLNTIDSLAAGPRPNSPVELTLSALFAYDWSSLYQALRRAEEQLGETIVEDDWLRQLRTARLNWLKDSPAACPREELGPWQVRILDASNYDRPKTRTVEVGYVHGADGMKPGHGLSLLSERVGPGSWTLPLEIAWFSLQSDPLNFGEVQIEQFVKQHGWLPEQLLAVDAQYTVAPFLKPVHEYGVPILGRVRNNRCFYLPPPEYSGFGRPAVRGRKIKLDDARTLPAVQATEEWIVEAGGRIEVSRWDDVRMKQWPAQKLLLYRVIEYKADGKRHYKRPLKKEISSEHQCAVCGKRAARKILMAKVFGRGANRLLIEDIPNFSCRNCGSQYLDGAAMAAIDEIRKHPAEHTTNQTIAAAKLAAWGKSPA